MDASESEKPSIPKFSSFVAKKPPIQSRGSGSQRDFEATRKRSQSPHIERRVHSHRSEKQHKDRHHESQSRSSKNRPSPARTANADLRLAPLEIFFQDTKGDESNITYRGANKWAVPKFSRRGAGRIMGADLGLKINKEISTERLLILDSTFKGPDSAKTGLGQRRLKIPIPRRLVQSVSHDEEDDLDADFISLGASQAPRPQAHRDTMEQVRDLNEPEESASESAEEDRIDEHDEGRAAIQRNAEMNAAVRSQPQDLHHWLSLIEHQEAMLMMGHRSDNRRLIGSERVRLAELRLSVYEEALKKTKGQERDQEILWKGLLQESARVQEHDQVMRRWRTALDNCPHSVELRVQRLDYIQDHYLRHGLEGCKREFCGVLSFIKQRYQQETNQQIIASLVASQYYVFLRLTTLLRDAGYQELSFALWQSTMDLSMSMHVEDSNTEESISSFGSFWDSEKLRLGETVWGGWKRSRGQDMPHVQKGHVPELGAAHGCRIRNLVSMERLLEDLLAVPGRMIDDYDESDTFHLVMFSDLKDILSTLIFDRNYSEGLFSAFSCFFGLPILPSTPWQHREWWSDPRVYRSGLSIWESDESPSSDQSMGYPDTLRFASNTISSLSQLPSHKTPRWSAEIELLVLMLKMLERHHAKLKDKNIPVLVIWLIARTRGVDSAVNETKHLMKDDNERVMLYNTYSILQMHRSQDMKAIKAISTPINMYNALSGGERMTLVLLWRTWTYTLFEANKIAETIHLLMSLSEERVDPPGNDHNSLLTPTSTSTLKSRQWVEQGQRSAIHQDDMNRFVLYTDIGMLLTYLTNDQDLMKTMNYIQTSIELTSQSQIHYDFTRELLHQSRTVLLKHHAKYVRPYIPAQIQGLLKESMALFPQNTTFLQEYATQELSFGLNDRLRNILPIMAANEEQDALPNWLFAIWFAHRRWLDVGGSPHAVRATLNRAVDSDNCQCSVALWLQFLGFEKIHGTVEQFRVVLNRALTKLPWVKEIVLQGLDHLAGKIEDEEIMQLYSLLEEREIRMHRDHI